MKLIDFGFSCFTDNKHLYKCSEGVEGTPNYLAPEVWDKKHIGSIEILKKSDVWSMGITFYVLAHLDFPFKKIEKRDKVKRPDLTTLKKSTYMSIKDVQTSKFINEIINKCLILDYKKRATAKDLYFNILTFIFEREFVIYPVDKDVEEYEPETNWGM